MRKLRLVLDTNVILSAVLWGGNPSEYFARAIAGTIELFVSPFILDELCRILEKKFRWTKSETRFVRDWYSSIATVVYPTPYLKIVRRKESDNRILECAIEAQADYLVTGDKTDLLPLKTVQGVRIVSPIEGLAILG